MSGCEESECPFCGSEDECEHLLLLIDHTFGECSGGAAYARWDEFESALEKHMRDLLERGYRDDLKFEDSEIDELWKETLSYFREGSDEVPVDNLLLTRLVSTIVEEGTGVISIMYDFEGGPGQSSSMESFYSEDTKSAISDALIDFASLLTKVTSSKKE